MPATSVRRNLFNSNFSKHSVPSAPPMQGANNNVSNVQSSCSVTVSSETNQSSLNATAGSTDNGEIVVKDKNGGYKLDIPVLPLVGAGEDGGEMEGFDESQNGGGSAATIVNSNGETEIDGQEKESTWSESCPDRERSNMVLVGIEASLIEMVHRNRNRQMSSEPTGMFATKCCSSLVSFKH